MYLPMQTKRNESIQALLKEVHSWMEVNFLSLNENKTEIIVFGQSNVWDGHDIVTGSSLLSCKQFLVWLIW